MINFADYRNLLLSDRTVRRFDSRVKIDKETLEHLVELTRYCASGRNAQPLRYYLANTPSDCDKIYPLLKWAGYYSDWDGPEPDERPVAYLIQCLDTEFGPNCLCDDGLQLQSITLGATTLGLGCCIIKAFNAPALSETLSIPERYVPCYVLALGKPAEEVKIEDMADDDTADFK
ncbi:MAG: nitroreductase family protein [Muribaculaceae bacterium]|nr:nitroreductase family protein [Muribaculaceae bacterium]